MRQEKGGQNPHEDYYGTQHKHLFKGGDGSPQGDLLVQHGYGRLAGSLQAQAGLLGHYLDTGQNPQGYR